MADKLIRDREATCFQIDEAIRVYYQAEFIKKTGSII